MPCRASAALCPCQVEDLQLALENGKVLAMNQFDDMMLELNLEQAVRKKMGHWRHVEAKNATNMEVWRKQRDAMQKVSGGYQRATVAWLLSRARA
jgi:hypothetical protein